MSSFLNVWSVGGAIVGGLASLTSRSFTQAVSGEGTVGITLSAVLVGAGLGLGGESLYHHWTETTPVTAPAADTARCVPTASKDVTVTCAVINGVPTYTYTPK